MTWQAEVLFEGAATGKVLRLDAPISFWGGVDPRSACITLAGHPQRGQSIAGQVLVIPQLIGSSSSSAVMLELFYCGMAPAALILGGRDAILPVGVVVARQMGRPTIPVVVMQSPPFETGDRLSVSPEGRIERL